jgi:3-phenylpropionate/trans-cinnamate dioxygenase ferredoxin reductase subunit
MVRRLRTDGATRANIHYLRALGNADTLREAAERAERVVVVGGSYIATEVAASLTTLGKACTIVMQEQLPLDRGFGPIAGRFVHDLLTSHGIEIAGAADVVAFDGEGDDEGPVGAVLCADGRRIEGDLVVVGSGALPDVMLARKAGLVIGDSGGVCCDKRLQTSEPNIFAAGDMCEYDSELHGRRLRIEHEEVAGAQGRHAARAMLGSDDPFTEVPYFWSDLADWATLEYIGPAAEWDEEIVHGEPDSGAFSVFYLHEDRLRAALAVGRTDDIEVAATLIVQGANSARVRGVLGGG